MNEHELELYKFIKLNPELVELQKALSAEMDQHDSFEGRMSVLIRYLGYNFQELEIELSLLKLNIDKLSDN